MPTLRQKLRQVEQAALRLTGDRRQAVGLRKKIERRLHQLAAGQARATGPQRVAAVDELQLRKSLIQSGRAGWVNDPALPKAVLVERGTGCVLLDSKNKVITAPKLTPPSKPAINRNTFVRHLKTPGIELFVPYMYLDCDSHVTVGVGHLLPKEDDTGRLSFVERQSGKPASKDQVIAAFNRVKTSNLTPGDWPAFRKLTSVELTEAFATTLAMDDMDNFLNIVRSPAYYPEFDSYPVFAKMGLLDLVYNRGAKGARDDYKRTTAAVRRRNWKQAGIEQRDGRKAFRANTVQAWFDQAARQEPFFISHTNCQKTLASIAK
jgi:hypothetical protein